MSSRRSVKSHLFSRIPAPGQLSFAFLAALPAAAPADAFHLETPAAPISAAPRVTKARVKPLTVADARQLAFDLVVVAHVPAPVKPETVFEFLLRHGKLANHTKAALRASKVPQAMSDESLRADFTQAAHIRWTEILVDPEKTAEQTFQLAALTGPQAIQRAASENIGAVYVPRTAARQGQGKAYAALVTASRNPYAVEDFADSSLLAVEDEVLDRADQNFLDARLACLGGHVTATQRSIAKLLLLDGILDAAEIAERLGLTAKATRAALAKLLVAFEAANDRDLYACA